MRRLTLLWAALLATGGCSVTEDVLVVGPGPSPWLEPDAGWTVEHPVSGAEQPLAAHLGENGEAWIVGTGGLLLHDAGNGWIRERCDGVHASLAAVVEAGGDVYAAGAGGVIVRRGPHRWARETSGTGESLRALAAGPDGAVWAAGSGGVLLRRSFSGWEKVPIPEAGGADLTGLAVLDDTLVVSSAAGAVLGYAGGAWRRLGGFAPYGVQQIVGVPGGLFACADSLRRYAGGRWGRAASGGAALMAAAGDRFLYATTSGGVYCLDPSLPAAPGSLVAVLADPVTALAVDALGRGVAASSLGEIARRRQDVWEKDAGGLQRSGRLVSLLDGSCLLLAQSRILVRREDGWVAIEPPAGDSWRPSQVSADGRSASDFYLLRHSGTRVLHWKGGWEEIAPPGLLDPMDVMMGAPVSFFVDADGDVWFAGRFQIENTGDLSVYAWDLWRRAGGVWRREPPPQPGGNWRLQRAPSGQVFACNYERAYVRKGESWQSVPGISLDSQGLLRLAGREPAPLVAVRLEDWLVRLSLNASDASWRSFGDDLPDLPIALAESRAGIFLMTREHSSILRLARSRSAGWSWEAAAGPAPEWLDGLHADSDGSLIGVGRDTGRVYRYRPPAAPFDRAP